MLYYSIAELILSVAVFIYILLFCRKKSFVFGAGIAMMVLQAIEAAILLAVSTGTFPVLDSSLFMLFITVVLFLANQILFLVVIGNIISKDLKKSKADNNLNVQ